MASEEETPAAEAAERSEDLVLLDEAKRLLSEDLIPAAIVELRKAVEINPALHEAWFVLGEACVKFEDWDKAADAFAACGDFDLARTYAHLQKISKEAGVPLEDLVKAMPQDFTPILSTALKEEEEAKKRAREAAERARAEEEKKRALEAAKEADDPSVPLPATLHPALTNTTVPAILTGISAAVWGFGLLVTGRIVGGLAYFLTQIAVLFFVLKETGVPTDWIALLRERVGDGAATFLSSHFPASGAGQISAAVKNAYFLSNKFAPGEISFWGSIDEWTWPLLLAAFWIFVIVATLKSVISSWYCTSKIYLTGYVCELRNNDVWVNFGFDQFVEPGDTFRVYRRTRYLKTVKADATVTKIEDDKCIVEVRALLDPESGTAFAVQVGDVVRK